MCFITDDWKRTQLLAANTLLRRPEAIPDGLESELYALLEKLDAETGEPVDGGDAA